MSEQIPWSPILAVLGVVIGWGLSQLTDFVKNRHGRSTVKKALINELSIIRRTLSDGKEKGNKMPNAQFPLVMQTYDSVKIELASFLKPDSLAIVQRAYEEIRKMNSEGGGHITFPPDLVHHYQFTNFDKIISMIDDSIARLK
jgi:hypothetical protein